MVSLKELLDKEMSVTNKVKKILEKIPETRDNDNLLCLWYWCYEVNISNPEKLNNLNLLFINNSITNPSSITRAGRKIKELFPELRGNYYKLRKEMEEKHSEMQNKLKEEIKNNISTNITNINITNTNNKKLKTLFD